MQQVIFHRNLFRNSFYRKCTNLFCFTCETDAVAFLIVVVCVVAWKAGVPPVFDTIVLYGADRATLVLISDLLGSIERTMSLSGRCVTFIWACPPPQVLFPFRRFLPRDKFASF